MNVIEMLWIWAGKPGTQKTIDDIILHRAAAVNLTTESLHASHLARGYAGIGYHYYIRKDGSIYRGHPEAWIGAHAGKGSGYNDHSIGICFEGNFETEKPCRRRSSKRAVRFWQTSSRRGRSEGTDAPGRCPHRLSGPAFPSRGGEEGGGQKRSPSTAALGAKAL